MAVGLTFQQVQSYERAANWISASKLYDNAAVFEAPVESFFAGLAPDRDARVRAITAAALRSLRYPKPPISPRRWRG